VSSASGGIDLQTTVWKGLRTSRVWASPRLRSHASREAEIMFLRQQLLVLTRSAPTRLKLRPADRLIFISLYRLFPALLGAAVIFRPETLVRWHRSGFRRYWRWKSRRRVGRQQSKLSSATSCGQSAEKIHSGVHRGSMASC
jgi:hypothetical protein